MDTTDQRKATLLELLSISLTLQQISAHLSVQSLLHLAASCSTVRHLIYSQPESWRRLDLSTVKSAIIDSSPIDVGGITWRAERMDESLTEDEFYGGPILGIFGRLHQKQVLKHIHTLILDGLSVPADVVREIVSEDRYNVKVLSLREAKNLNQTKLQQVLRYIVRATRPRGTPKLRALYVFGSLSAPRPKSAQQVPASLAQAAGVTALEGAQIGAAWNMKSSAALSSCLDDDERRWYSCNGRVMKRFNSDWPDTLQACQGLITFDAVLCRGPRHDSTKVDSTKYLKPAIASIALGPAGCQCCGSCPEQPARFGTTDASSLPLLAPTPLLSASMHTAQRPDLDDSGNYPNLFLRCEDCLRGRWCERCNRWWCEDCYEEPVSRVHLRTDLQQLELRDDLRQNGWADATAQVGGKGSDVKVYSKLCVERCLVSEMMSGAGSNGMWG